MIKSLFIAIGGIVGLMLAWVAVQALWRKTFSEDYTTDEDVLAGRRSCGNCGCTSVCKTKGTRLSTN